jgi:prepilin-type N-terminal cleavage/methylation domain-containing protein
MQTEEHNQSGHTLVELLLAMVISLIILSAAVAVFSGALSSRQRELSRTDAITSAQAALNIMSREIGNSGYGLAATNGLVLADCGLNSLRFRANTVNSVAASNSTSASLTSDAGEDVVFLYDSESLSVVRFDRNTGITSGVINQVSDVDFEYYDYNIDGTVTGPSSTPTANTSRVTVTLDVFLRDVQGQPSGRVETVKSDITLRNSPTMRGQY